MFLLFTAIMRNRQEYSCYLYSEQATENMPAESEPPLPSQSIVGRSGFSLKTSSVKYLLMIILFEYMFSII